MRRVVCAAIRADDGSLLLGIRHYSADMVEQIKQRADGEKFQHRSGKDQGFVDQVGAYMTREEAFTLARQNEQIINWDACDIAGWKLYSEGLY